MSFRHRIGLSLLVALLLPASLQAAVKLEYLDKVKTVWQGQAAVEEEFVSVTVVDGPRVYSERLENTTRTTIVDRAKGEVLFVNHKEKTFQVGRLPFHLEDYVEEEYKSLLQADLKRSAGIATIDQAEEVVQAGPWRARKVHVEATAPLSGNRTVLDVWLTTDPDVDYETCDALARVRFEPYPFLASWSDELLALDGVTARQEFETVMGAMTWSGTSELLSAAEVEVPPEAFRPPAGYREVPLDYSDPFKVKKLPP